MKWHFLTEKKGECIGTDFGFTTTQMNSGDVWHKETKIIQEPGYQYGYTESRKAGSRPIGKNQNGDIFNVEITRTLYRWKEN